MGGRNQRKLRGGIQQYYGVKKFMGKRQVGRGTSPYGNVKECTTILYHTNSAAKTLPLHSLSCPSDSPHFTIPLPYSSIHAPCTATFPPGTSVTGMWFLAGTTSSPQWGGGGETEIIKTEVFHIQLNSVFHTCQGLYLKILNFSLSCGQRFAPIECGHLEASIKQ